MSVTVRIKTDNAAFETPSGLEVARILRDLADRIEDWPGTNSFSVGLRDANGNTVGTCKAAP